MRTIKFRCWDDEQKKMILDGCVRESDEWGDGGEFITICLSGAINLQSDDDGGKNGRHEHSVSFKNGRFKLMQFTGLHDKNGVEIFEGDICKIRTTEDFNCIDMIGEVRWLEKYWCYRIVVADHDGWSPNEFVKWVKVIGNVFSNPELLKEGAE